MHVRDGQCLIINQKNYGPNKEGIRLVRKGTEQDEKPSIESWTQRGCDCHIARDLRKTEMISTLKEFRGTLEKKQSDFMVLIILGHGRYNTQKKREEILDINYEGISMDGILEMFLNADRCPSVANKTKLFYTRQRTQIRYFIVYYIWHLYQVF